MFFFVDGVCYFIEGDSLTDKELATFMICKKIVEGKGSYTLKMAEKDFGIPDSTLSSRLRTMVYDRCPEFSAKVINQLSKIKRRSWYIHKKFTRGEGS